MVDIGANLCGVKFKQYDIDELLTNASKSGVIGIVVTGSCMKSSKDATYFVSEKTSEFDKCDPFEQVRSVREKNGNVEARSASTFPAFSQQNREIPCLNSPRGEFILAH